MNYRPPDDNAAPVAVLDAAHMGQTNGKVSRETRVHRAESRSHTPNLLELGLLAATAGIVGLLDKDRVALFTKVLETADRFHDFGERAGSRGAILRSEATSEARTPGHNLSPLLGALGIVVAFL
jgi:hypothetical protein